MCIRDRLYIVSDETGIVELSPEFEISRREDIPESLGAIRSAELTEDGLRLALDVYKRQDRTRIR